MDRLLASSGGEAVAGWEADLQHVLLELPANVQHVGTITLQGAAAMAYFAARGQPVTAARGCTAVHCLEATPNQRLVSSVVQLLLDTAAQESSGAAALPFSSTSDVVLEHTAAQTMPPEQAAVSSAATAAAGAPNVSSSPTKHEPGRWRPPSPPELGDAAPRLPVRTCKPHSQPSSNNLACTFRPR